jgi:hypothetical protein
MNLYDAPAKYEKVISTNEDNSEQVRLVVNSFRGKEYLHLRKYYQDFDEEWKPSKDGIAMAIDFDNTRGLFEGLVEIISLAESREILEEHFSDLINHSYQPKNTS